MALPVQPHTAGRREVVGGLGFNQREENVAVFEVIDDITIVVEDVNVSVAVAADIAANVCGVAVPVAVLSQQVFAGGGFTCSNASDDTGVVVSQR